MTSVSFKSVNRFAKELNLLTTCKYVSFSEWPVHGQDPRAHYLSSVGSLPTDGLTIDQNNFILLRAPSTKFPYVVF